MCGITGILKFDLDEPLDPIRLRQMCRAMVHRGPDDEGEYVDGNVGLSMRRLSIIDVEGGHQPLSNEDGTVWIVFNGEIYNHSALRKDLQARGHLFRSQSDTEAIVHAYEEYGADCVQRLRGMFAFAIWDGRKRQLFVARDRLGIKPLYYHLSDTSFSFGSEIKVLFASGNVRPEFKRNVLPEYLAFGYLSGPETFYEGISKLMPGHYLLIDAERNLRVNKYWEVPSHIVSLDHNEAYYVREYRGLLEQSVSSHMMSDVPIGVFLSGGLDSSAVAALMARTTRTPINTFSVGYSEAQHSELPYAREVARHLKSTHHEVYLSEEEFFQALPIVIWHEDEPVTWPSSVALFFVARLAQQHVKVVLTGEGSDETLAGYSRYAFTLRNGQADRLYRGCVPSAVRDRIRRFVSESSVLGAGSQRKLAHTFLARNGQEWQTFYFDNFFAAFDEEQQRAIIEKTLLKEFRSGSAYASVLSYWNNSQGEMLGRLLCTDIKTYLVELLMKQDNMSMAASVESRVPFLDHHLVEFTTQIPERYQIRGLAGKNVLKKCVRGLLPDSIIHRKKLGFPTPWSTYLAGPRLDTIQGLLNEPRTLRRNLFDSAGVSRLFAEHQSGHRDHSNRIWRLLNLELWHRVCLEAEVPANLYPSAMEAGIGSPRHK